MQQPTVQQIAGSFVGQYYNILLKTPENLHKFYKADSTLIAGFQNEVAEPAVGEEVCSNVIILQVFIFLN